ncbi:MAG: T9SS type A sorting domain-containing protein [Ignavibacteria bacterium]|nr:T9SS type A sorting domain-containing protein [Ignavibacteria bacterium]
MRKLVISLAVVYLQCLFLLAGKPNHSGWPLEVLSWDIDKAYPGIEYNYRLAVKGGEYPYEFTLVDGPSGMTINKNSGEILWKPVSLLTDTVVIKISDKSGNSLMHRFDITSTKTGFYFVDGAKGNNSNNGSEASPWKTMAYASATADSASYVYVKKGTYSETFTMVVNKCGRFFAYPGDSVVVIGAGTGTASFSVVGKNRIFQGFVFDGRGLRWIFSVAGSVNNVIWRKNEMRNVFDTTRANPCFIFFWNQESRYTNMVIQNNIFHDLSDPVAYHGASVTYYAVVNSLYEDNHAYDIDGDGVDEKVGGKRNTFRNNIFNDIRMYQAIRLNSNPSSDSTEICYNLIYNCTQGIQIGSNGSYVANIFVHHNTCLNPIILANLVIAGANSNNINIYKNIIGNGTQYPYSLGGWPNGFTDKVAIDSNIVYGLSDLTRVVGTAKQLNWAQWQDSGFDVNSKAMQLKFDSDNIPILPDSLKIYGCYGGNYNKITDIKLSENENPYGKEYSLSQNYPNPFNPSTTIKFNIPNNGVEATRRVVLKIFDILGREVITLVNEHKPAGNYTVEWNGTNSAGQKVGSGIYFYQLKTGSGFVETKKMLLLR